MLLRDLRIIIPSSMRQQIVQLGHAGHQGKVKTSGLIRFRLWFPKIDAMVDDEVKHCYKISTIDPLRMSIMPSVPWQELAIDFLVRYPTAITKW